MRARDLMEDRQISLAKAAYQKLSPDAQSAIQHWEMANWIDGPLERHLKNGSTVAVEIEAVFAPIRATLPAELKLYRGIVHDEAFDHSRKYLESWTSDRRVAEVFAGWTDHNGRSQIARPTSQEVIDATVERYERTGFASLNGTRYIRNKQYPQYYDIYDRSRQHVTDGDDLRADLESNRDWLLKHNEELMARGTVLEEMISRDRIVWLTNNLNCKEYLVRIV